MFGLDRDFFLDTGKFLLRKSSFTEANFREIFKIWEAAPQPRPPSRTIPASDHVGIATVAPLWSLREATCEASRPKKDAFEQRETRESAIVPGALSLATEWTTQTGEGG